MRHRPCPFSSPLPLLLLLLRATQLYRVVKVDEKSVTLERSARHKYTRAWYAPAALTTLRGVALCKDFAAHSFQLIASGSRRGRGGGGGGRAAARPSEVRQRISKSGLMSESDADAHRCINCDAYLVK